MPNRGPCTLKRTSNDVSDAIILAFNQKWNEPLLTGQVGVVFRKRGPRSFVPNLMYAYLSAPISAIVARMSIISYVSMPTEEVINLADRGAINRDELQDYARGEDNLLVMTIGQVAAAKFPITFSYMAEHFNYWPSSTFIPLSKSGALKLDDLGHFEKIEKRTTNDK